MKKIIVLGKHIMLAAVLFAGLGLPSCSDDELSEVAAVRPDQSDPSAPSANGDNLASVPTITDISKISSTEMKVTGTNLTQIYKWIRTYTAEADGKLPDGTKYKAGDVLTEDIKPTSCTETEAMFPLLEGKITAYYNPLDNTKCIQDGGFGVQKPTVTSLVGDFDAKKMTITGKDFRLGEKYEKKPAIVLIKVGEDDLTAKAEFSEDGTTITLPLWEGKVTLQYDENNPGRKIENDGYKFPVPVITKSSKEGKDKMTIEGSNFQYITKLTIGGEDVTDKLPADITAETTSITLDFLAGKIEAFYFYNDEKVVEGKSVTNKGLKDVEMIQGEEDLDLSNLVYGGWGNGTQVTLDENGTYTHSADGDLGMTLPEWSKRSYKEVIVDVEFPEGFDMAKLGVALHYDIDGPLWTGNTMDAAYQGASVKFNEEGKIVITPIHEGKSWETDDHNHSGVYSALSTFRFYNVGNSGIKIKSVHAKYEAEKPKEYVYKDLTKDMFQKWPSFGAATSTSKADGAFEIDASTTMPFGDGNVDWLNYADLSKYETLLITVKNGGGVPRFCMNRSAIDGQASNGGMIDIPRNADHTSQYQTVVNNDDDTKTYIIDLAAIKSDHDGIATLHSIKSDNGAIIVTKMQLGKEDIDSETIYEASAAEMKPHSEWGGVNSEGSFVGLNKFKFISKEILLENPNRFVVLHFSSKTRDLADIAGLGGNAPLCTNASDTYGSAIDGTATNCKVGKTDGDYKYVYFSVNDFITKINSNSDAVGASVMNWWGTDNAVLEMITIDKYEPVASK